MANDEELLRNLGVELRSLRLRAGLTLEAVAETFGRKRDNLSKIELGRVNLALADYLDLMHFYRAYAPNHPSHALRAHLRTKRRKRS